MDLFIDDRTGKKLQEKYSDIIRTAITECLNHEDFTLNVEISVSIVTNGEIKRINKRFRHIDAATDCLSFPMVQHFRDDVRGEDENIILGDIFISYDKAIEQATDFGHSLEREIAFLAVHSTLHLLGYDHKSSGEEKVMFGIQDDVLQKMGINR